MTPVDWHRLPCGCQFGTVGAAFVIEPCQLTCPTYLMAIDESDRRGKTLVFLDRDASTTFARDTRCPWCGRENDRHTSVNDAEPPAVGDCGICSACGRPGVFTETGMRRPTPQEMGEFAAALESRRL
jgi:hypothetical protein